MGRRGGAVWDAARQDRVRARDEDNGSR
jgi:hypothetical protein